MLSDWEILIVLRLCKLDELYAVLWGISVYGRSQFRIVTPVNSECLIFLYSS